MYTHTSRRDQCLASAAQPETLVCFGLWNLVIGPVGGLCLKNRKRRVSKVTYYYSWVLSSKITYKQITFVELSGWTLLEIKNIFFATNFAFTLYCSVFEWRLTNIYIVCTECSIDFISALSGSPAAHTSIFPQYEIHGVADCRHRTPGDHQDNSHLLKSLITPIQRLEDLLYQLHIWAAQIHSDEISSTISDTLFSSVLSFYLQCSTLFLCSKNSCLGVFFLQL